MTKREKSRNPELAPAISGRRGDYSRFAVLALFLVAAASQARLQILEKQSTIDRANKMHRYEFTDVQVARRGKILARDGEPLAKDDSRADLAIDFKKCPNTEPFWLDLSHASGVPATQLSEFANEASQSTKTKWEREWPKAVSWSQANELNSVISKWRADGVGVSSNSYRSYPLGEATSCLVGIIRRGFLPVTKGTPQYDLAMKENRIGPTGAADELTGIERSKDDVLRGKDGKQFGVKDRNGNFLPMRVEWSQPKKDGQDVTLTIDQDLQTFAAAQVKKTVEENHAESGTIVVENPENGDLLAIANYPSFKPYAPDGNYSKLGESGGLNQAYMSCLEPGSMFKILTLAKALDAGVVKMTDHFFCPGEEVVVPHSKPIRCDLHGGTRAQGELDPVHAIAKSCNIWAAIWARKIGYDPFKSYLTSLGLLDKPDIGVPGTQAALVNWKDPAKQLQLANLGFGQSINCTPVGLIGAFSTIANDGVRMAPRLIKAIGGKEQPLAKGKYVVSPASCENVKKGMIAVMEDDHGTGRGLRINGYQIAGKTGTAQKMGSKVANHVSNFIGFVPAEHPRAVVLVMINRPSGTKYYGAAVAGPVFKAMAQQVIRKYRLEATEPIEARATTLSAHHIAAVSDDTDDDQVAMTPPATDARIKTKSAKVREESTSSDDEDQASVSHKKVSKRAKPRRAVKSDDTDDEQEALAPPVHHRKKSKRIADDA